MKPFILIISFLLSTGSLSAQLFGEYRMSAECFEEHRMQIPDWFLFPYENEYVGVSLPSPEPEERICFALISALISYEARLPRSSAMNRCTEKAGDGIYRDIQKGAQEIGDNISFRIVRQFVNENGELFVALQIIPDSSEHLHLVVEKIKTLRKDDKVTLWECGEFIECSYPELEYNFSRREKNQEVQGSIMMVYKNQDIYRDLKELPKLHYADIKNSTEEFGWYYECKDSLHVAYMRALYSLILEGVALKYPASLIDNRLIFYRHD